MVTCCVCSRQAEVSWPDGKGDQVHFCGKHEPWETYPAVPEPEGNALVGIFWACLMALPFWLITIFIIRMVWP
jgi:hypothetical protein